MYLGTRPGRTIALASIVLAGTCTCMVGINFVTMSVHVLKLSLTCVVKDKLNDILNLVKSQVVLWPLSCVPVYPHSWSICEVALLYFFEPRETNVMEEQEGALTHALAVVVKPVVSRLSLLRSGAMVTMDWQQ